MSSLAPPDLAVPAANMTNGFGPSQPPPRPRRRRLWWLVPLLPLSLVAGGIGQSTAAATITVHEALRLRHHAVSVDRDRSAAALSAKRDQEVVAVLDRMSAALAKRDLAGYLAAFDRNPALRRRQTATFQALGRMPFAQIRYGWDHSQWTRPLGLTDKYGDDAIMAVVHRQYLLKGWDVAPTGELVTFAFATRDGRMTVVTDGVGDGYAPPEETVPEPWTFGDVSVIATRHALVVGDRAPARQKDLRRLANRVEEAVGDVRSVWSAPTWNGHVVVYALTDPRFLTGWMGDQWSGGTEDDDHASFDAWVSTIEGMAPDGTRTEYPVAGARMVVTPGLLRYSAEDAGIVIRHELTHVATFMHGKQAPTWLSEGVAEYTAFRVMRSSGTDGVEALHRRGLPRQMWNDLRRSSYRPDLVSEHDYFYSGTGDQVDRRYSDGWFASLYIADKYGEAKLRAFYDKASDASYATVDGREEAALRTVLGTDSAAFAKAVGAYARGLRRNFQ